MSWLRDPETGEVAKALDPTELKLLEARVGRHKQRRGWHWVVKRDESGKLLSAELRPIPKDEVGLQ